VQLGEEFVAEDLRQMQVARRYNTWLYSIAKPYLGKRVLEIGSGIGNITEQILACSDTVFGIEPNAACAAELEKRLGDNDSFDFRQWRIEDCDLGWLRTHHFDSVACFNVLEHVERDLDALEALTSILEPGGRIVLLLPAVPWAFGPIDRSVGHFRRYSKRMVREAFEKLDLRADRLRYVNLLGLIGWLFNAHVRRIVRQSDQQIRLFDSLVPVLARIEGLLPPPLGLTLLAVGRK
jgi:SAM-dependent methyltransferase